MSAYVRFRSPHGVLGVPVTATRGVLDHGPLTPLPVPRPGVAGVHDADGRAPLVVLDVLGPDGLHVLVLEDGGRHFGLIAEAVLDVVRVAEGAVGPPPAGQLDVLLSGIARTPAGTVLLVDVSALAQRLDGHL